MEVSGAAGGLLSLVNRSGRIEGQPLAFQAPAFNPQRLQRAWRTVELQVDIL